MSMEPRIAETSASMWPRLMKSIACKCGKPGAGHQDLAFSANRPFFSARTLSFNLFRMAATAAFFEGGRDPPPM